MFRSAFTVAAILTSFGAFAGSVRDIPTTGGTLQLEVADDWRETRSPSPGISLESKTPGRMQLLLTPLPVQKSEVDVRRLVQDTADRIGPESVERKLKIEAIRGNQAVGNYFKATDPAPKAGEYRFMYQGAVIVGSALVTFTILYNDGAEKDAELALSTIRTLRLRPGLRS